MCFFFKKGLNEKVKKLGLDLLLVDGSGSVEKI